MQIKDLKVGQGQVIMNATVTQTEEIKTTTNGQIVQTITIVDTNGDTAKLSLWNEKTGTLKTGDYIGLHNCYVNKEYLGKPCITTGKFGKIIDKNDLK